MTKENLITTADLVKLTVNSTGYHKYEVEDILLHALAHTQRSLAEGKTIRIRGIGQIARKFIPARKFYSSMHKKDYQTKAGWGVEMKADLQLKEVLYEADPPEDRTN